MSRKSRLKKRVEIQAQRSKRVTRAAAAPARAERKLSQVAPWMALAEVEWRNAMQEKTLGAKFGCGLPIPMKEALRRAATKLEMSMSEFERRLLFQNGIY